MLRTSTARLLASASRRAPMRPISSTAPAFIRIKKPEGAAPPAPSATPATPTPPATPSPAEKPASAPEDLVTPPAPEPTAEPAVDASAKPAEVEEAIPDKPDLSQLPSLDIDPELQPVIEEPKEKAKGKTGGKGKKAPQYESSIDRQRRFMSRIAYGTLLVGGLGAIWYVGEQEKEKQDGSALDRFKRSFAELSDYFSKPAFTKLLPDPLPAPHQRPYTLLVDLEDLLVHSTWDRQHGWRTAKRPGVDYFLGYLSQFYEIVLFTSQPVYVSCCVLCACGSFFPDRLPQTALPVAEKLDPFTLYLPYKLFRESTRYIDGKVVKDLEYLNRDLSKVVMLDTNSDHSALQPDNAIVIQPWDGSRGDKGLVEMIPFLECRCQWYILCLTYSSHWYLCPRRCPPRAQALCWQGHSPRVRQEGGRGKGRGRRAVGEGPPQRRSGCGFGLPLGRVWRWCCCELNH